MTRREKSLETLKKLGFKVAPWLGTGVIHERRHALTWATSPRVKWDDTDLST